MQVAALADTAHHFHCVLFSGCLYRGKRGVGHADDVILFLHHTADPSGGLASLTLLEIENFIKSSVIGQTAAEYTRTESSRHCRKYIKQLNIIKKHNYMQQIHLGYIVKQIICSQFIHE